ncbi:MAG TPA: hypothetical protein PKD00_00670 [Burkholderiales bacterium]|nr:hypothetical protein [Burkholderiales bacterium]
MQLTIEQMEEVIEGVIDDAIADPKNHKIHTALWEVVSSYYPEITKDLKGTDKDCWQSKENMHRFIKHIVKENDYNKLPSPYKI